MRVTRLFQILPCLLALPLLAEENPLLGCWQRVDDPAQMLRFEEKRVIVRGAKYLEILIPEYKTGKAVLRNAYGSVEWQYKLNDGRLTIMDGENTTASRRLKDVPAELDISALKLPAKKDLSAERIKAVREELAKRVVEDQAVRKDPARSGDADKVDADNTCWLRQQVLEIGWIDARRFGASAANAAFLFVQHSGDLRLMQAALPEIEKDMKSGGGDPQNFALFYDRTMLRLGEKQRYGSQIGTAPDGTPVILPLEDPAHVEQRRREIGLYPLSRYLKLMEQVNGKKVKMP